jgi:hypothetical protein
MEARMVRIVALMVLGLVLWAQGAMAEDGEPDRALRLEPAGFTTQGPDVVAGFGAWTR